MHAVYEQVIEDAEVQPAVTQQQENDRQLVLKSEENSHADVLQAEEGRQRHPEEGGKQAAAEIEKEPDEAIHPSRLQVQVKVVVLGAYELGGARRATGGVHAGGVRAVEGANPPWDGNDRHGWIQEGPLTGLFQGCMLQENRITCRQLKGGRM